MPLSETEYKYFFGTLTARQVLRAICVRRAILGCYDPAIQALDRYENHGVIPDGWICSDFPDNASFPGFCDFALYRCIMRKYFAKRVLCPDETTQKSTVTQPNQEGTPGHIVISTRDRSLELPESTPTTSTESSPEPLATTETAAVETLTTPLPSTAAKAPLHELLSSSTIEMAAKLISQILTAFTATKKPPKESFTAEPLMELTPASPATATSESSSKRTTTTTDEFIMELTSTPAIVTESELSLATEATFAAPTEATTTAPTESFPEFAMELIPDSASDTAEIHTTAAAATSDTETCIVDYPEPLSDSTDSTSATATTATSSTSILPIHAATTPTYVDATTSSTTTATPQLYVPAFDVPLPFPPPQPNSTMRILILSFIKDKNVKNGDMAGTSPLPQTALGSGNILLQEEVQSPLPANGLKDLILRLHDKRVQQLIHKMHHGISGEQKPQLLSHALQLLSALSPRSDSKNRPQS